MFTCCLAVSLTWVLSGLRAPAAEDQIDIVYRSLRAEGHDQLDSLDLPRRTLRESHWGWEVRTRHFVVFSTVSPQQARWTAEQMEQVWSEIGLLADQWTRAHRQPSFGIGAVSVVITDQVVHPRAQPAPGPNKLNYDAALFVKLTDGTGTLQERLPQLRREAFAAFLRVAQQDQVLPDWVQFGLAEYISGEKPPSDPVAQLGPPRPVAGPPTGVWNRRTAADRMTPLAEGRPAAILWVRYLLVGNDATHAPDFFHAMAAALENHSSDPFQPAAGVGAVQRFAIGSEPPNPRSLEDLVARASQEEQLALWLADRETGQPIVRTASENMPLDERQREMVLILKLARRFPGPPKQRTEPRIVEFGARRDKDTPGPTELRPLDLRALYRRLTDPARPAWATVDTNGALLLSSNRKRLAAIFDDADARYRVALRDGHSVLEARLSGGTVLEAWLEENSKNPHRPIVYIKPRSYQAPHPASPAADRNRPSTG